MKQFDVNSPTSVSDPLEDQAIAVVGEDIRRAIISLPEAGKIMYRVVLVRAIDNFLSMLEYALAVWPRKQRTPMDVDAMLAMWKEAVVKIATAPDKKAVDEWEAKLNDLLEPFLKCPVAQIKEFCRKLIAELDSDQSIPFFVKIGITAYIKIFVEKAVDQGPLELKKDIAGRIAQAVEGDVKPQLAEAITNALMWRDPATLEKIEAATKRGKKAKLVGRESCLFLEVDGETVML